MDSVGEFKPTESEVGIESSNDYEEEVQKIDKGKQDVEHMNSNNDCGSSSSSNEEVAKRKRDVETHSLAPENVQE
nr:10566_t:CDS:2 [Entrophospora candida]